MIPGEIITLEGTLSLNAGRETRRITVANTGDRPIQVGSHYHFYETNRALELARESARGFRPNLRRRTALPLGAGPPGGGQLRGAQGDRIVYGFQGRIMGALS